MTAFFGRQREMGLLQDLRRKRSASLVVLKGRRRIGKSRLAEEFGHQLKSYIFAGLPPADQVDAQAERDEFSSQLSDRLALPPLRAHDWSDLLRALAQQTVDGPVLIVLDEINWIGAHDPTFLGKLKIAWDLHFSKNPQLIMILSGSVSGWIERNILSHTGFLGRISLNMTLDELPLPECNHFWGDLPIAPFEKFKLLSVTGGVPRYLEELLPELSAEENLLRLCFRKEGLLFNEFEQVFSDLFSRRSHRYREIVSVLSGRSLELTEIYTQLGESKSGLIGEYLDDLVKAGFITRDYTWSIQSGRTSKLSRFRLSDNYLRFYLRYIAPNREKIERGLLETVPNFSSILGLQFENLVLKNRKAIFLRLGIKPEDVVWDNPFFQRKTKRAAGCQIDYLIQTRYNSFYLCEIKFLSSQVGSSIVAEVKQKIDRLIRLKGYSVRPVLIHVNGVTDELDEENFFASTIDFSELLG